MPRAYIEPKYKYSGQLSIMYLPNIPPPDIGDFNPNCIWREALINNPDDTSILFAPTIALPKRGSKHDERNGNRITVNTIRWKMTLRLYPTFLSQRGCPFYRQLVGHTYGNYKVYEETLQNGASYNMSPPRWFKFRLFAVQFEDGLTMNRTMFYQWFYSTFCPLSTDLGFDANAPPDRPVRITNRPISVHSNVLRMTTNWTGKFNILMDKCFTLYSNKPAINFDLTIPLNKPYKFQEGDDAETPLLSPNIWLVLMPPQQMLTDMDPVSCAQYEYCRRTTVSQNDTTLLTGQPIPFLDIMSWAKLSYTDL